MRYVFFIASYLVSQLINRRRRLCIEDVNTILIIKLDHIGDVLTALPALSSLRSNFPDAKITIMAGSWAVPVIKLSSVADEIIEYNAGRFARDKNDKQSLWKKISVIRYLCAKKFDLVVGLQETWVTLIMSLIVSPRYRLDRGTCRIQMKRNQKILPETRNGKLLPAVHEVNVNFSIVKEILAKTDFSTSLIMPGEEAQNRAGQLLVSLGLKPGTFIVCQPGAVWKYRQWNARKFAELSDRIHQMYRLQILVAGITSELPVVEEVRSRMRHPSFQLTGKSALEEFISVLIRARMLIANDGGPVHLASALGIPVVSIMGYELPEIFGPWGAHSAYIHKRTPCCPCRQVTCVRPHNPCIDDITVDDAFSAVKNILDEKEYVW